MNEKALLTVREYAKEARVTERTIRRWITEGRLKALRQGKKYLIPKEESATAQLGGTARPQSLGARTPMDEPALRYLLFWMCDHWVDNGAELQAFCRRDRAGAERYFKSLVDDIDREALQLNDTELGLRLRFVARDLLNQVSTPPEKAEPVLEDSALAPTQTLADVPQPAHETMPLRGSE
jgi:excisionase family DNA binding protein